MTVEQIEKIIRENVYAGMMGQKVYGINEAAKKLHAQLFPVSKKSSCKRILVNETIY